MSQITDHQLLSSIVCYIETLFSLHGFLRKFLVVAYVGVRGVKVLDFPKGLNRGVEPIG